MLPHIAIILFHIQYMHHGFSTIMLFITVALHSFPSVSAVDFAYEGAGKRTFLPMLLLFSLIFPLWLGLLILYPWIAGKRSYAYYLHKRGLEKNEDEKKKLLISGSSE